MSTSRRPVQIRRTACAMTAVGLLVAPAVLFADDTAAPPATAPAASAPAPETPAPINMGMDAVEMVGLKPTFDDLHLNFSGWVEASYTYNAASPSSHMNAGRVFDNRSNAGEFDQLAFYLERDLASGKDFDWGFKVEGIEGYDARFIHSNGLGTDVVGEQHNFTSQEPSIDATQFYGLVRLPVGEGLTIKVGKFVTPIGAEVIDAIGNNLFSHSYTFYFADPYAHTGVEFDYPVNDKISVYAGVNLGWDQFEFDAQPPSYMGGVTWKTTDKLTTILQAIVGPEELSPYPGRSTQYRELADLNLAYQWTDPFSTSIDAQYGYEDHLGSWYGVTGYGTYVLVPSQVNANVRYEVFQDESGTRLAGLTTPISELTLGFDVHPFKDFLNLRIRPEGRWDYAYGAHPFDDGQSHSQFTAAADVIITF